MFGAVKTLLSYLAGDLGPRTTNDNQRLVTAALLTRVATVHSEMSEARRETLHVILRSKFALDDDSTRRLLEDAIAMNRNAIDLYRFTRQLNEIRDDDGRSQLVQMMWELVYADGPRTILTRISFGEWLILLGVSSRRRVELRRKVSLDRALSQARDVLPQSPALASSGN